MEPVKLEVVQPTVKSLMGLSAVKRTERAVRTAYRSFDKMTKTSHQKLFQFCFKNMHWSVFEHHYIRVTVPKELSTSAKFKDFVKNLNPDFIHIFTNHKRYDVFEGNTRAFMDLWKSLITQFSYYYGPKKGLSQDKDCSSYEVFMNSLKYVRDIFAKSPRCVPFRRQFVEYYTAIHIAEYIVNQAFPKVILAENEYYLIPSVNCGAILDAVRKIKVVQNLEYYTFNVVADIAVGREWLRHTPLRGVTQESTRYCSYQNKGFRVASPVPFEYADYLEDFAEEKVYFLESREDIPTRAIAEKLYQAYYNAFSSYNALIEMGLSPQQARTVLPLGTIGEFVITGHWTNWAHFCKMRCAKDAHPQIRYLAKKIHNYFERNLSPEQWKYFLRIEKGCDLVTASSFCKARC